MHGIKFMACYFVMKTATTGLILLFLFLHCIGASAQQLVIKGQKKLKTRQGEPLTLRLSDVKVDADKSLNYPNGFYLLIDDGDHYSVNGNTIIPDQNFVGELNVPVRVTNAKRTSERFTVEINVRATGNGGNDNDDDDDEGEGDDDNDDDGNGSGDGDGDGDGNGNGDGDGNGNGNGGPGASHQKPTILSQVTVEINKGQSFKLELTHLVVNDPDSNFPKDFILKVEPGANYSVSGTTITPASNFTGRLTVSVKVNDGHSDSNPFDFKINVMETIRPNVKPVITGQTTLSTFKNEPLMLALTHLSVTDPDNPYPSGFTLVVLPGANYSVSGNTVTPAAGFSGIITIQVKVNDGREDSNVFDLRVSVIERGTLQIVGHTPISILEDSAYVVKPGDLKVSDPSDTYPSGYTLSVLPGENYTVEGQLIRPKANYAGSLTVPLKISKGNTSSNTFSALVIVHPINDAPTFSIFDNIPIGSPAIANNVAIASEVVTADVDNERLAYAEIAIDSPMVNTELSFTISDRIRGAYDIKKGLLIFIGEATLAEYDKAIRSVTFSSMDSLRNDLTITFRLNDGSSYSPTYTKVITNRGAELQLTIPTAFTPNNDNANDTWEISLLQLTDEISVQLRVYNQRGLLLFETDSFTKPWDGRFNGELLPSDSYFYTLIVSDQARRVRRDGVVTILR